MDFYAYFKSKYTTYTIFSVEMWLIHDEPKIIHRDLYQTPL